MIHQYIAPFPYTLADALLAEVFTMHYGKSPQANRRAISSGSCLYKVHKIMGMEQGEIYLRELSDTHTYIRLITADDQPDLLLMFLTYLNDLFKQTQEDQSRLPSIDAITRSQSTIEAFAMGAAYYDPPRSMQPAQPPRAGSFTHPEDKRAFEELRVHPEQRDEIHERWVRAVRRNKERTISAKSMGPTWRRLVSRAKEQKE